jgi:hypothetical protein
MNPNGLERSINHAGGAGLMDPMKYVSRRVGYPPTLVAM